METLLVVGIDTVAGANIAATLKTEFQIEGVSLSIPISLSGCPSTVCDPVDRVGIQEEVDQIQPDWIVYCGPAAQSSWTVHPLQLAQPTLIESARLWAQSAHEAGIPFTAVCSDAIFTGPWMFHQEDSTSYCDSEAASNLLKLESEILKAHPQATLVRTHVFGWAPVEIEEQSVSEILLKLEQGRAFDGLAHASPIHASHLAEILEKMYRRELTGTYHVGSSERVSPLRMAGLLALEFDCAVPETNLAGKLSERPTGFSAGETSLLCSKLRTTLGIGLPLVSDGIRYLAIQKENGYCSQFVGQTSQVLEQVA